MEDVHLVDVGAVAKKVVMMYRLWQKNVFREMIVH